MILLTLNNPKLEKGRSYGWLLAGLHLAPAFESGTNMCPAHTRECASVCLYFAGRGTSKKIQQARIRRAKYFIEDREFFLKQLRGEIAALRATAFSKGLRLAIRLNVTSDVRWERFGIPQEFPDVMFYDYTKIPGRSTPDNYKLCFSFSGHNLNECLKELAAGRCVAIPFRQKPVEFFGYPVIDGDAHDLRFLDPPGHVVALSPKGRLRRDPNNLFLGDRYVSH